MLDSQPVIAAKVWPEACQDTPSVGHKATLLTAPESKWRQRPHASRGVWGAGLGERPRSSVWSTGLLKFAPSWRLQEQGGCWTPPVPTHPPTTRPIPASQSLDIPHWLWQGLHYFAPEASAVAVTAFESLTATEYTASLNGQEVPGVSSGSVESGSAGGAGASGASIVQMPSAESYARMALLVAAAQALPGVQAMAAQQPPPAAAEPPPLAQAQRVGVGQGAAPAVVVVPAPAEAGDGQWGGGGGKGCAAFAAASRVKATHEGQTQLVPCGRLFVYLRRSR
ncbi:MAG: hypothetical protein WDW36_002060 [Sanguina aurantia]